MIKEEFDATSIQQPIKVLTVDSFEGMDWHDQFDTRRYLRIGNSTDELQNALDISGIPTETIAQAIMDNMLDALNSLGHSYEQDGKTVEYKFAYTLDKDALLKSIVDSLHNLPAPEISLVDNESGICASIRFKPNKISCYCDLVQYEYNLHWRISTINNPLYFAIEEFYAPAKGAFTVERTYTMPFKTYEEAYQAMLKIPATRPDYRTGRSVQIMDVPADPEEQKKNPWFRQNAHAFQMMHEHPELSDAFNCFPISHINAMREALNLEPIDEEDLESIAVSI